MHHILPSHVRIVFNRLIAISLLLFLGAVGWHVSRALAVGEPITRIQCPAGYQATLYAENLSSPDGLAFDPGGVLHVGEETAGRVSRVNANGTTSPVLENINSPEGIAFDADGNLYVVEDVANGRLIRRAPDGTQTTLASNLAAPEGVVWATGQTLYVTESNVQFSANVLDFQTHVTAIIGVGQTSNVRTDTILWSYAGITLGADGLLYVTNEAAGVGSTDAVFAIDPSTSERVLLASGLTSPEGLNFAPDGQFPLYVAEEGTGGSGRLSQVDVNGTVTSFCTGFQTIEDVVLDTEGRIYVSEDGSGSIIVIAPPTNAPGATATPSFTPTALLIATASPTALPSVAVTTSPTTTPTATATLPPDTGTTESMTFLPLVIAR